MVQERMKQQACNDANVKQAGILYFYRKRTCILRKKPANMASKSRVTLVTEFDAW